MTGMGGGEKTMVREKKNGARLYRMKGHVYGIVPYHIVPYNPDNYHKCQKIHF
jgi:hypothetical protein